MKKFPQILRIDILTDVEKRSDAYQHLRSVAKENPMLATYVACQIISETRIDLISGHLAENGYSFSTANPLLFLKQLCLTPEGAGGWSATRAPHQLDLVWDHPRCFNRNGKPSFLALHPYARLGSDELAKIIDWCKRVGLEFQVDADSEYFPGMSLRVCLYAVGGNALNTKIGRA